VGTTPTGINDQGQVVGTYYGDDFLARSFLYDDGVYTPLEIPGALQTIANGINNRGQIAGTYLDDDFVVHNVVYDVDGEFTEFPTVPGAFFSDPIAVNDRGQVVGSYSERDRPAKYPTHGYAYADGAYTVLDFPGAAGTDFFQGTRAQGVNNAGQVVGFYDARDSSVRGFVYARGVYTAVDVPGAANTYAYGINDRGQVVGSYQDADGNFHTFVLSR
jgi:probable HAF family extracellular repeat protein